jgi:hypothetical protein
MAPISTGRALLSPRPRVGDTLSHLPSDRWLALTLVVLALLMTFFVAYTTWQQKQADDHHHRELVAKIEQQDRDLRCYADHTRAFELAVTDMLTSQQKGNDPLADVLRLRLAEVRDQLIRSDHTCGPRAATATTTTR